MRFLLFHDHDYVYCTRRQVLPYKDTNEIEHFIAGLRKAGLVT